MQAFKTEGVVIKRKNFGEADRILTVFTRNHGKIKVLAKGVRRITSRRGPNVELFNLVELIIHKGKTLDILTEAEVKNTFPKVRENLDIVGLAFHVCELIEELCPERQSHPKVFDLLTTILSELDRGLVNKFEHNLLLELGYLSEGSVMSPDRTFYIEEILEKRLKTRRIISQF